MTGVLALTNSELSQIAGGDEATGAAVAGAGTGVAGVAIGAAAASGYGDVAVSVIVGAGTVGEIALAASGVGLALLGGALIGYGLYEMFS